MLPAPCRAPSPATAVPPPPPPRTATHLCLPSRSLASAGKLRGSCRKTRSLLTQPEAPSRPPLPAPRRERRRHSLGAASNHRGKGEGEGGVRSGAAAGAAGAAGSRVVTWAGAVPGRAVLLRGRVARRPAALPGAARMRAPPAPRLRRPQRRARGSARRSQPGPAAPRPGREAETLQERGPTDRLRGTRGRRPGGGMRGASRPLCWFLQVTGAGSSAHGRGPEHGASLVDVAPLSLTSPQRGLQHLQPWRGTLSRRLRPSPDTVFQD